MHIYFKSHSSYVLFVITMILFFNAISYICFAQETEIFRNIGYDLNVDSLGINTDNGGMLDVNNDGWIDLVPGSSIICLNRGVVDGSLQPFRNFNAEGLHGELRFADFNNDGLVDAYGTMQNNGLDPLFRNEGNMTFVNVADSMGVAYPATKFSLACGWADYNNDGWVDLLVGMTMSSGLGSGIYLWKNEGGKHFVNVADQMQVNVASMWHGLVWADFDNDGDQDFFIAGGRKGDKLFRNDVTKFVDISEIAKITGVGVLGHSRAGSWGDFNNDGRLDLYVCDDEKANRLFRNDGDGVWPEVAAELHVHDLAPGGFFLWDLDDTPVWGDFDNDGDLDLLTSSQGGEFNKQSQNRLYRNDGAAGFVEIGHDMELAGEGQTYYAAAMGDVDNDGDLDLYIVVGPTQTFQGPRGGGFDLLYENMIGNQNNWLEFRLTGVQSNRSAIGTRITCIADTLLQIREVQGGNGYNSMNPFRQHFGFGQRTVVDSVIIRWPSGTIDRFIDVPVNQILDITEGSTSGIETRIVMPEKMNLEGNYPNPFNPMTTIRFTLPKLERVRMDILDITGRHVRTLVDDRLLSGVQQVRWDGRDDSHRSVASGIYLCRLVADGTLISHRMTLLR